MYHFPLTTLLLSLGCLCLVSCKAQQQSLNAQSIEDFKDKCPEQLEQVMEWQKSYSSKPDTVIKLYARDYISDVSPSPTNQEFCLLGVKRATIHSFFGQPKNTGRPQENRMFDEYVIGQEWTIETKGHQSELLDRLLILYYDKDGLVEKYLIH